jgi:hypothetical protein
LLKETPKVLNKIRDGQVHFSVSHYMWTKIYIAVRDPKVHYPYAPYIMHIIEQVTGKEFLKDVKHKPLRIRNPYSPAAKAEFEKGAMSSAAPSASVTLGGHRSCGPSVAAAAPSVDPRSSSAHRGHGGSIKYAFSKFFEAFCYKMKRDDHRLQRIEQKLNIDPPSPLREFRDPFVLYREERAAAKAAARAARAPPVDESGPSSYPHGKWASPIAHLDVDDEDTTEDEYEDDDDDGDDFEA